MDTEKPDPNTLPRKDPKASPLGRGADPGPSDEGADVGALHGAGVPGEKGGSSGSVHHENEDVVQIARDEEHV